MADDVMNPDPACGIWPPLPEYRRMKKSTFCILIALLVLVSSCAPRSQSTDPAPAQATANQTTRPGGSQPRQVFTATLPPTASSSVFTKPEADLPAEAPQPQSEPYQPLGGKPAKSKMGMISQGSPKPAGAAGAMAKAAESGTLSFDKAEISEVAHQIFGDHLQLNYILDPNIKGLINLHMEGEFTRDQLLQMVIRAFQEANVEVTFKDGIYYIKPMTGPNRNLDMADPTAKGGKDSATPVIVVYRPRFVQAQQGMNIIKSFLTPGRANFSDQTTNTLVFVDTPQNAKSVLELLKAIDINLLDEIGMEIVPLKTLTPAEAVKTMTTVMGQLGVFRGSTLKDNLVLVPLEHYRGVLIFAQDQAVMEIAKQWLTAIDVRGMEMGEQINVYQIENAMARDISDILGQIFGKEKKKAATLKNRLSSTTADISSSASAASGVAPPAQASPLVAASAASSPAEVIDTVLTGPLSIIPDENNNALVIRSNPRDYATVKKVIQKLDLTPRAVLIEVVVAEVRLTNSLQYGVEWFLRGRNMGQGTNRFTGMLSGSNSLGPFDVNSASLGNMASTVMTGGLTGYIGTDGIQGLVSLLDQNTDVNILSTPSLLALDNTLASITVGGREPTVTQQQQSTTAQPSNIVNSIQYQETGLVLRVIPHISSTGVVRLEVEQKIKDINDVLLKTVNLNTPRFTERQISTTLVAEDGRTVILGGLISASKTKSVDGIPILGQIPILGFFFAKNSKDVEKTELLISITPHIVKARHDPVQTELLQRLEGLRRKAKVE